MLLRCITSITVIIITASITTTTTTIITTTTTRRSWRRRPEQTGLSDRKAGFWFLPQPTFLS
jgi:hypothetical protein